MQDIKHTIELTEGVQAEIEGRTVRIKGDKGELERTFMFPKLSFAKEGESITITVEKPTKREKTKAGTARAHIRNMIKGVKEGHTYKLKICSGHFPMNVTVSGDTLTIKNFLGEKIPRTLKIKDGANVKIDGEFITVNSTDKEIAGQVAADIEQLTRITNRDIRIFQDGIYITEKA